MAIKFEVRQHPSSPKHLVLAVVKPGGFLYVTDSAWTEGCHPKPSKRTVQYLWKNCRHCFIPYSDKFWKGGVKYDQARD